MNSKERSFEMAKRLKVLREEKGLSHVSLSKELKEKYGISISRDSLINYEISEDNRTRAQDFPNLKMKVQYLLALADFYGVSTDYLLCQTDTKSPIIELRQTCDYTGLSEMAALGLNLNKDADNPLRELIDLIAADSISNNDFLRYCQLAQTAAEISQKSKSAPSPTEALISAMEQAYISSPVVSTNDSSKIIPVPIKPDGYINVPAIDMQIFYSDAAIRIISDYAEEVVRNLINGNKE